MCCHGLVNYHSDLGRQHNSTNAQIRIATDNQDLKYTQTAALMSFRSPNWTVGFRIQELQRADYQFGV